MKLASLPIQCTSISVFLFRHKKTRLEVLLLRRKGKLDGFWCQIAGKIESGEKAWEAALREVKEETGLCMSELWSADICEQFYDINSNSVSIVPIFLGVVCANEKVVLNEEHNAFEWVNINEALDRLQFRGQRENLKIIQEEFFKRVANPALKIS